MAAWWSFATPFVQCLSIHVVNKIKEGSKTDQLNYLEYTIATAFLLVIPLLQLRVVLPYTLSKENGRWGLRRWVFNHSERATARKDVTWALAFKVCWCS